MDDQVEAQVKKRYEKPRLESIRLTAKVATLGACKTTASTGPQGTTCMISGCYSQQLS